MKLYNSFLLRCWVIRQAGEPVLEPLDIPAGKMVFDVEHIQKGEHHRAASPEEVLQWIVAACQNPTGDEAGGQADEERK